MAESVDALGLDPSGDESETWMRLSDLLPELRQIDITPIGTWEVNGRRGITLGNLSKTFPNPTGPQYPVDCTRSPNPDLTEAEVSTMRRRFGIAET